MESECPLYLLLEPFNFFEDFKDFSHHVFNRQIKIDDQVIDDPKFIPDSIHKCQVGLRIIEL